MGTPWKGGRRSESVDPALGLLREPAGFVVVAPDDRVDRRVEAVDLGQAPVQRLDRRDLPRPNRRGEAERRREGIGCCHRRRSLRPTRPWTIAWPWSAQLATA